MSKRKKSRRGTGHTTSLLTALFAVTPALFVLTTPVAGASAIQNIMTGGGSWQSINGALYAIAQVVINNWVALLIVLAVAYVGIKVVRKLGRGARITRHLTA